MERRDPQDSRKMEKLEWSEGPDRADPKPSILGRLEELENRVEQEQKHQRDVVVQINGELNMLKRAIDRLAEAVGINPTD